MSSPGPQTEPVRRRARGIGFGAPFATFIGGVVLLIIAGWLLDDEAGQPLPPTSTPAGPVLQAAASPVPSATARSRSARLSLQPSPAIPGVDLVGRLLVLAGDPGCSLLVDQRGHWSIDWPTGYRIERIEGVASLIDEAGRLVARLGDVLGLAGSQRSAQLADCEHGEPFSVDQIAFVEPRQRAAPEAAEIADRWTIISEPFLRGLSLRDVAAGPDSVLALGRETGCRSGCASVVLGSSDGLAWRELWRTHELLEQLVTFDGQFTILGRQGGEQGLWLSAGGENWRFHPLPEEVLRPAADGGPADSGMSVEFSALSAGPRSLLLVGRTSCEDCPREAGSRRVLAASADGQQWQRTPWRPALNMPAGRLVAIGPAGLLVAGYEQAWWSVDGRDWSAATGLARIRALSATDDGFVAASDALHHSSDGLAFEPIEDWLRFGTVDTFVALDHSAGTTAAVAAMQYEPAVGADYAAWWSVDGRSWRQELIPSARVASALDPEWAFPADVTTFRGHVVVVGDVEHHPTEETSLERSARIWIRRTPLGEP